MSAAVDRMLPLYEAKMIAKFDHRDAGVVKSQTAAKRQNQPSYLSEADHQDPWLNPVPGYWVAEHSVPGSLPSRLLGFSNVTSPTNQRTMIAAQLPRVGAGHSLPLIFASNTLLLCAILNSFVFDYVARQKVAGVNFSYMYLRQLPVPPPRVFDRSTPWDAQDALRDWLESRAEELVATSWDLPATRGDTPNPFVWSESRRAVVLAEIDAALFHVYGVERGDVDYIMDTFPIVKRKDEAQYGEYRTKRLILENYDRMQECMDNGTEFVSTLNPPPGFGPRHPERTIDA
ncbi:hypothetical protein ACH3VR_03815 [Microbacterium sp. B2969]|uniref:Site-specific DNA-methyltransferase (adenine-specific) n=1 Tax=Microbacterium alkaliflavum TaxID=3248839 RepID=A0ABW7Q4B2_9MICO